LRLSSFGGCGLALAALVLVVLGAYDSYPVESTIRATQASWSAFIPVKRNTLRNAPQ